MRNENKTYLVVKIGWGEKWYMAKDSIGYTWEDNPSVAIEFTKEQAIKQVGWFRNHSAWKYDIEERKEI